MKSYPAILPAALLLLAAAGCASAKPGEPAETACMVRAADVQLGDKLLEALRTHDYDTFAKLWGNQDKKMTPEEFKTSYETIEKQFGEMQSFSYLTELKTPLVQNRIWTVRFERKADQGKDGRTGPAVPSGHRRGGRQITGPRHGISVKTGYASRSEQTQYEREKHENENKNGPGLPAAGITTPE